MRIAQDTIIWITGASSGIGEHIAYTVSTRKPVLILSARNMSKLKHVAAKCNSLGAKTVIYELDLRSEMSIQTAAEKILEKFDHVDILINNAGVSQRSLAENTSFNVDKELMQVNYFGTVLLTKLVLPTMIARKSGQVVVVSSLAGKLGFPLRSAYSASKHALHGFFETLATEVSKYNINITIAIPSHIKTDIDKKALTANGEPFNRSDPNISKGIPPDKCARKIVRAIEKNRYQIYITGKDKLAFYIRQLSPKLYFLLIKKLNLK